MVRYYFVLGDSGLIVSNFKRGARRSHVPPVNISAIEYYSLLDVWSDIPRKAGRTALNDARKVSLMSYRLPFSCTRKVNA